MSSMHIVERFSAVGAMTRFFRSLADRPSDAARLLAMDGLGIAAALLAIFWLPNALLSESPGFLEWALIGVVGITAAIIALLAWETAWQRFMAGGTTPDGIPWRLGKDEGLLLYAWIVATLMGMAVAFAALVIIVPLHLMLVHLAGLPDWLSIILMIPLGIVAFVVLNRFSCGISLSIVQGRMSVFEGFAGSGRHLWGFGAVLIFLTLIVSGVTVIFDHIRGFEIAGDELSNLWALGADFPDTWPMAAIWLVIQALSAHLLRGLYMESALATAHAEREDIASEPGPV